MEIALVDGVGEDDFGEDGYPDGDGEGAPSRRNEHVDLAHAEDIAVPPVIHRRGVDEASHDDGEGDLAAESRYQSNSVEITP